MTRRQDFEAWAKSFYLSLDLDEHECFVDARVGIAANAWQAATLRQEEKIKALRESLQWALSNISEEPYEWSCEEDSDAHTAAIALAKETP